MSAPESELGDNPGELPDLIDSTARTKLDSVTDVNGSVARFEMAYSPVVGDRFPFGPPLKTRLPAYLYLVFASVLSLAIAYGYGAPSNSRLFQWIVVGDRNRPMSAASLAIVVFISAIGTVLRSHMRGVVVRDDGVEARFVLPMGIPRVKRWMWAQILRIIVSADGFAIETWDGGYERLPDVAERGKLKELLVSIANARKIQVTELG
jgi:hypothetical protein